MLIQTVLTSSPCPNQLRFLRDYGGLLAPHASLSSCLAGNMASRKEGTGSTATSSSSAGGTVGKGKGKGGSGDSVVKQVQIDGLVVLKIIKHYQEEGQGTEVVQGVLLGMVVEDRLEITNCFPFPQPPEDDADFDEEQSVPDGDAAQPSPCKH